MCNSNRNISFLFSNLLENLYSLSLAHFTQCAVLSSVEFTKQRSGLFYQQNEFVLRYLRISVLDILWRIVHESGEERRASCSYRGKEEIGEDCGDFHWLQAWSGFWLDQRKSFFIRGSEDCGEWYINESPLLFQHTLGFLTLFKWVFLYSLSQFPQKKEYFQGVVCFFFLVVVVVLILLYQGYKCR